VCVWNFAANLVEILQRHFSWLTKHTGRTVGISRTQFYEWFMSLQYRIVTNLYGFANHVALCMAVLSVAYALSIIECCTFRIEYSRHYSTVAVTWIWITISKCYQQTAEKSVSACNRTSQCKAPRCFWQQLFRPYFMNMIWPTVIGWSHKATYLTL
jgi:hypothetical protein